MPPYAKYNGGNYSGNYHGNYPPGSSNPIPIPTDNLYCWLDASVGTYQDTAFLTPATANGEDVKGWQDQSGNGNSMTSTGIATLATNNLNGETTISMPGTAPFVWGADNAFTAFHVFIVVKNLNIANGSVWVGNSSQAVNLNYIYTQQTGAVHLENTGGVVQTGMVDGTWGIIEAYWDGAQAGIKVDDGSYSTGSLSGPWTVSGLTYGFTQFIPTGYIAEAIFYEAALSPTDVNTVQNYLNSKYAIY